MPHEKVNFEKNIFKTVNQMIVGWGPGWVQVSVSPPDAESTGDWLIVDMLPEDIDRAIKALKKAKRKGYETDYRAIGYSDE